MTEHYVGVDVHKTESQVAVLNELGKPVEEIHVNNANLDEIAEKYAGSDAAIEAGSNYFTIYDMLDEYLDVTLAIQRRRNGSTIKNRRTIGKTRRTLRDSCGWERFPKVTFHPRTSGGIASLLAVGRSSWTSG